MLNSNRKQLLFVLAMLCLLVIIPSTFASDLTENTTLTDGNIADSNSIYVSLDGDDSIADGSKDKPYNSIEKAIENYDSSTNSNVYIKNGSYNFTNQIKIDKEITIVGESSDGVKLNGNSTTGLFSVSTSGNVEFNSLSFINGLGDSGWYGYGGAIDAGYVNHLIVDNCNFINNTAGAVTSSAGASDYNYAIIEIKNSKFINNTIDGWGASGGAVSVSGIYSYLNMTNCVFNNNSATYGGGAVSINNGRKESFIAGCEFIANTAEVGSAIHLNNAYDLTVKNSIFKDNVASDEDEDGGVIEFTGSYYQRKLSLGGNTFENNIPGNDLKVDNQIEVIYLENNDKLSGEDIETMNVGSDENFTVTLTDSDGNPVSGKKITVTLTDLFDRTTVYEVFTNNNGQAIVSLINQTAGTYTVTSVFAGDDVYDYVQTLNSIRIKAEHSYNIVFNETIVKVREGDSYLVTGYVCDEYIRLVPYVFNLCEIKWHTHGNGTRVTTNFKIDNGIMTVDVLDFDLTTQLEYYYINFTASGEGTTAQAYGQLIVDTSIPLPPIDENIETIYVSSEGSDEYGNGSQDNPLKTVQAALYVNELFGGNKTVYVGEGVYNISNCEIYADVDIVGVKGKTIFRQHNGDKGMLYLDNKATTRFTNITFIDGYLTGWSLLDAVIVVRYPGAVAEFEGCEFYNNSASSDGVIFVAHQATAKFNNCIFANNTGKTFNPAGVIEVYDASLTVNNSYFYNNAGSEGAAICIAGGAEAFLENTVFYKNRALNDTAALAGGGALFINNWNTHIYNCSFIENYAELNGGAIYILVGMVDIQKSLFENNRVEPGNGKGSAIASDSGYSVHLYIDHSILITDDSSKLISIVTPMEDGAHELIYNDNYWGSNSYQSYDNWVTVKATPSSNYIYDGDLVEITVEFKDKNSKTLEKSVHDYLLNITTVLGKADVDSIVITDNVAKFNYYALKAGNETITFNHNGKKFDLKFSVEDGSDKEKLNTTITVNDNKTELTVTVDGNIANNITVILDNNEYSLKVSDGKATLPVNLLPGNHTARVSYAGDDNYKALLSEDYTFTIDKLNADLSVNINDTIAGEDILINITSNSLLNGTVTVNINNKNYTVTVTNGKGSKTITSALTAGNYSAKAIFDGNDYILPDSAQTNFEITDVDLDIIYVSATGNDNSGDGSQINPYATISKALDRNKRLGGNKTIIVSEGNYTLNRYAITDNVTIIGEGKVVISPTTNTNHLFIGGNVAVSLENLTFTNGKGVQAGSIDMGSDNNGNNGKTLTITNCNFINNTGATGAIVSYANTTIVKSTFINNIATGKTGYNQAIISIRDNTVDLKYSLFINNDYANDIIVSTVEGKVNDNFWGDNNKPGDVSDNLELKTWVVIMPSIYDDIRTKTNYDLTVEFKQTNGHDINDLNDTLPDLTVNLNSKIGTINPDLTTIINNAASVNYNVTQKGFENITVLINDKIINNLEFEIDVPEYDKIYVSPEGRDSNNGNKTSPVATIKHALELNDGGKTIIILPGTYDEGNLNINKDVEIIGYDAILTGDNLFTITANTIITNVTFKDSKNTIKHESGEVTISGSEFKTTVNPIVSKDTLTITDSIFDGNSGMAIDSDAALTVANVKFNENEKAIKSDGELTVVNSTFTKNNDAIITNGDAVIRNNTFDSNTLAINSVGATVTINDNAFNGDAINLANTKTDLKANSNVLININNSTLTNTVIKFINGETIIIDSGKYEINATVTDDNGNIINGGEITFTADGETIGKATVNNGIAKITTEFIKGDHIISGTYSSDSNAEITTGTVRADVDYYWFINETGYETLADAVDAAGIGDIIKGVPGTYDVSKQAIGHRYFSLEPWEVIKSVTITSLTDEPVILNGNGKQMFYLDVGSELTLQNIIIKNAGSLSEDGGAIETLYDTNLTIINCTFINNTAENGGAVYVFGSNLIIKDTVFESNTGLLAGALQIVEYHNNEIKLDNLVFINNSAVYGGAFYNGGADVELTNVKFINNTATVGGAVFTRGGLLTIYDAEFINNKAVINDEMAAIPYGGAIHNMLCDLTIYNSQFINNSAEGLGGALELENGLYGTVSWTKLDGCTFTNNTAREGGAIYLGETYDPYVTITSSIFDSNSAESSGAAISSNFGHVTIDDSKFINNYNGLDVIHVEGDMIESDEYYSLLTITKSEFENNTADYTIFTNKYGVLEISDSKFTGEDIVLFNRGQSSLTNTTASNTKNNVIENYGILSLDKNTFNTPILNNKEITSDTYIIVLDNQTKKAPTGEKYIIKAVVVDDNGNIIEKGNLTFIIGDDEIKAEYINTTFQAEYLVTSGDIVIAAKYDDSGLTALKLKTGIISAKNATTITITVNEVKVGSDAVITVNINNDATGNITVTVNGKTEEIPIKNGIATLTVSNLTSGVYSVTVKYAGDDNYAEAEANTNLTVSKIDDYKITVETSKAGVNDNVTITVTLPEDAKGNITITVENKTYAANIIGGKANITIPPLAIGTHDLTVNYNGDDKYSNKSYETTFKIAKMDSYAIITVQTGENTVITVETPLNATGDVIITVDGKDYFTTTSNGKATVTVPDLTTGVHEVTVTYNGDALYLVATNSTTFNIGKNDAKINASATTNGDDTIVTVELPDDATGTVTVTSAGKNYSADVKNGKATITIPKTADDITVKYSGDDKYSPDETTVKASETPEINIPNEANLGETPIISVNLPNATGEVSVLVDGVEVAKALLVNGKANIPLENLSQGGHLIEVKYGGDDNNSPVSKIAAIAIHPNNNITPQNRIATILEVEPNFTRVANDYYKAGEKGAYFYAVLKDTNGNVLANKIVQIAVNGAIYNVTTDNQGRAGLQVNLESANVYTYALSFKGDDDYDGSPLASSRLTVTKKTTSISASNKVFKKSAKKTISVTLKTSKNPYDKKTYLAAGKKITLKINGKTYSCKINSKGVVKFTIKLTKKGTFKAKIKFAGDKTYKASSKTITVKIK